MTNTIKIAERHRDFFEMVYEVVKQIPPGRVTSYGVIARYLGMARSARMVGWAMNSSHRLPEPVPAHRVVNRIGMLSGKNHFGEPDRMKSLLEAEGLKVENDIVQNFDRLLWDPAIELKLH
jgi:methylated-DNA-protein-cysteine methyltransferase-like protein